MGQGFFSEAGNFPRASIHNIPWLKLPSITIRTARRYCRDTYPFGWLSIATNDCVADCNVGDCLPGVWLRPGCTAGLSKNVCASYIVASEL